MTTAADLIKGALRSLRRLASNEDPKNEMYSEGLSVLNMMLDDFATRSLFIYATTQSSKALTVGTATYTIGASADISATRPVSIESGFIRDSDSYDHKLNVLFSEDEYNRIVSKETSARPRKLWYKPEYPKGKIHLYPTPDSASDTLYINGLSPFTAFAGITTSVSFPPGYWSALENNLAVRLAPKYGVSVSPEVAMMAASGLRNLESLNFRYRLSPVFLDIPGVAVGGWYNGWTDEYE